AVLAHHAATAVAGAAVQRDHHDDRRVPGVHGRLRAEQRDRKTVGFHAVLHAVPLPERLQLLPVRLRLGDGVGAAARHRRRDRRHVPRRSPLGVLRRRAMTSLLRPRPATAPPRPRYMRTPEQARFQRVLVHAALIAAVIIMIYPLLWMLGSSFRPSTRTF